MAVITPYIKTRRHHLVRHIERMNKTRKHDRCIRARRRYRYYTKMLQAWPQWCANSKTTEHIYREAKRRGKTVDHIVPLSSPIVCGLHVPWNLEIVDREQNESKGNYFWPDCPHECLPLFADTPLVPYQLTLIA